MGTMRPNKYDVAISGALCSDYVIMSQCAHNKAIHIAHDGKVSVTDTPTTQNITIAGTPDFLATNIFKVTLFAKETQMYLCFNNHWRLVGMEKLQDSCYFKESIVHGYFEFRSILNLNRRVGFTHRGKPIGPKKNVTDACYHFEKVAASEFSRTHTTSIATTSAAGSSSSSSNGHNSSNNNSISATSNSRSRHSSSNLNSAKRESSALSHRNRHRKNRTQIGPRRLHHVQETQEVHTRLRHHQLASSVPEEVSGSKRKKKKKKKALPHGQARQQYLNPKDPAHRRIALELHEQQQQQQQQQPFAEGKPHEHSGDGDMVTNIQDEYSNDDASAVQQDLPNTLDSSTDYLFSSSGSISSTRHMAEQHSKKPLLPSSTNRRRATISNLSSSSTGHRSVDVNLISRSSSKDSQTPRKYYKTLNPSLVVASYQSTVVGDQSSDASNKIAVTGLARSNHNDKNLDDCARRSTSTPRRRSAKCAN